MNKPSNPVSQVQLVEIAAERDGQRIDNFLINELKDLPRSRIYRLLRKGEIRVNKKRTKPTYRIQAGDVVRLPPLQRAVERPRPTEINPQLAASLRLATVWESNQLLVLNKPSGMAVHGGSGVSLGVIEALRLLYPEQKSLELVHRLDRETSGCLLITKKRAMLRHLHAELQAGRVDKTYLALVQGQWPRHLQQVDAPLRKNELVSGERMVSVDRSGKAARTMFRVRQRFADCTLLEVKPITGRTHQIRVHARHMGHPLAGDSKYGSRDFNQQLRKLGLKRLFLHAQSLRFTPPDAEHMIAAAQVISVKADLSADLEAVLEALAKRI